MDNFHWKREQNTEPEDKSSTKIVAFQQLKTRNQQATKMPLLHEGAHFREELFLLLYWLINVL